MEKKDKLLSLEIEKIHRDHDDTLGHKKIALLLKTGKNRINRVMKKYNLVARKRKKGYHYHGKINTPPAPNIANNETFLEILPDMGIIYSDIFEFQLADQTRVRGCFALLKQTRQCLSLVFDYSMKVTLVHQTIDNIEIIDDRFLLWHDDQGRQYGAHSTREKIIKKGLIQSMSRPGTPTDNPFAERFVSTFKHAVCRKRKYYTFGEFLQQAKSWINFYNNQRPHEGIDNLTPNQFAHENDWPIVAEINKLCVY